jgi:hypothetical protein
VVALGVAQALVLVIAVLLVVRANEVNVINKVPLQIILELLVSLVLPEMVVSLWVSVVGDLMAEASIDHEVSLLSQEEEVVAGDSVEVPGGVLDLSAIGVDVELVVGLRSSVE